MKKLLAGGLVWQGKSFAKLDVLIEDGVILAVGGNLTDSFAVTTDCSGVIILPALVDMHVHVCEKISGYTLADDFASLSRLARIRGVHAIGAFMTEQRAVGKQEAMVKLFTDMKARADNDFHGQVRWHLTPTLSQVEDVYPLLAQGCDLKFYTTYRPAGIYRSYREMEEWMAALSDIKPRMLVHCEDDKIVQSESELHPFRHPYDHAERRPELAENIAVERLLDLATKHNYPVHVMHVSSPRSALLIEEARKAAPVSCETAPHYLLLNDAYLLGKDGHRWLCTPPLRSEASRGKLVEFLQDGLFDAIATDHCPFRTADKDRYKNELEKVPSGIAGLGATFPLMYENFVKTGKLPLENLIPLISDNPAGLLNLAPDDYLIRPGAAARFILLKVQAQSKPEAILPTLADSPNPWQGFTHTMNYSYFEG